jgi:hypothetical protein
VYTHIPKEKRLKHESHINLGIFVGYTDTDRLIKVYDPLKRTIKSYRDVVIDETLRWSTRLATYDNPGEYELVAPSPQEYFLSPIVPLEGEGGLEDTFTTPRDFDSDDEDTYEDPQEFEPPPPAIPPPAPIAPARTRP